MGFGKSTLLRDAAARASQAQVVCVVDTKGELGGLGARAHDSLGFSRRLMVGKGTLQKDVIRAAMEKHAARTMVIDELWTEEDFLEVMMNCRMRGVQVLAGCPARGATELVNARRTLYEFDCVVQVCVSVIWLKVIVLKKRVSCIKLEVHECIMCQKNTLKQERRMRAERLKLFASEQEK